MNNKTYKNIKNIKNNKMMIIREEEAVRDMMSSKSFVKGVLAKDLEDLSGKSGMVFRYSLLLKERKEGREKKESKEPK